MNKRQVRLWMMVVAVLVIAGAIAGGLGIFGLLPWQRGNIYQDPQGRYSMLVDPAWKRVETDPSYIQYKLTDPPAELYVFVVNASNIRDAYSQAIKVVGGDPGILSGGNTVNIGDWQAYGKDDAAGLSTGLVAQIVAGSAYVVMIKADKPGVSPENAAVMRTVSSFKIAGKKKTVINSYADLEAMMRQEVDNLSGSVSVAMLYQDKIVYSYVYGKANPAEEVVADAQTIYQYGSMTKPFTATALMQLVEQGRVNLDAWPGTYVPEFPKSWKITVRQLLDHSACLPDNNRLDHGLITIPGETFAPLKEIFTTYVKDYPDLVCEPGKTSQYSNPHYLALARIIEEVSGEPYESYIVKHVLTPLKMESTSFELVAADLRYAKGQFPADQTDQFVVDLRQYHGPGVEDLILQKGERFSTLGNYRILPPWGGLRGTPNDVTHFLQMYLDHGRYGNVQILKPETVAAMQTMQKSTSGAPLGLGLCWFIEKDAFGDYYNHDGSGSGFHNVMRYYPKLNLGLVVMGNMSGYQSDKIAEGLVSAWKHEK